ncbi:MAG TPA: phage terminase large subunit family protein [Steroidobacteraceae bacterium]|jgi:phage terminase large subunit GpA-like protein
MDAVTDPANREIWVKKSAQVGWTDVLGNVIGYYIDQDPSPMLLIQPTLDTAEAWSKDRLAPMLRDTPRLRGRVKDARSRDSGNTLLHKQFHGGHITAAGANSPASLAQRPIRVVMCDDVDRFPASAGAEGDPIKLSQKRSNTFWNRRFLAGSTPTVRGASRISIGFAASDQRYYFVPCPHCAHEQRLEWKNVRWPEGQPEQARYLCERCGALWDDGERAAAVRRGAWRATKPFKGIAGFHIWEAYAPWRTLAEIVADFLAAKAYPDLLKVWTNTCLGEEWEDKAGEGLNPEDLAERAGDYEPWTVPDGALLAVCGVDTQHDRLEVGTYAFGPGEETWAVAHDVIYGAPARRATWQALDDLLAKKVRRLDGKALPIAAACIDASDGQTTGFVLDFASKRAVRHVMAIKGQAQPGKPPIARPSKTDVKDERGRIVQRAVPLWPVGSDTIKGVLMARLGEEGFVHFPAGLDAAYYEQLASEKKVTKFRAGVPYHTWVKQPSVRNEALDCFVYAYAAAVREGLKRANWKALEARLKPWADDVVIERPALEVVAEISPPVRQQPRQNNGFGTEDWVL